MADFSLLKIRSRPVFSASKMGSTTSQLQTVQFLWPRPLGVFLGNVENNIGFSILKKLQKKPSKSFNFLDILHETKA